MMNQEIKSSACLNCGTPRDGAEYCPHCGQEHRDPVRSVNDLVHQVLDDIFSLDSRIARTVGTLFRHPGRLTQEYLRGRRVRYVPPLRLYLMSSLVFFLALTWSNDEMVFRTSGFESGSPSAPTAAAEAPADSSGFDASRVRGVPLVGGLLERRLERLAEMGEVERNQALSRGVARNLPKGVFAMLPVFALALKLVYVRRSRGYVEHFIFALHVHAFAFLVALPTIAIENAFLRSVTLVAVTVYIFLAMRRVYAQSRSKTVGKFVLLSMSYGLLLVVAMATTAIFSALTL